MEATTPPTWILHMTTGHAVETNVRMAQIALALARSTPQPCALFAGRVGWLRLLDPDDQVLWTKLCHAAAAKGIIDRATSRVYLRDGHALGSRPDGYGMVVVAGSPDGVAAHGLCGFGQAVVLGARDSHPQAVDEAWPVDDRSFFIQRNLGSGVLVVLDETSSTAQIETFLLDLAHKDQDRLIVVFDPNDTWQASWQAGLPNVERMGPQGPSVRKEQFARCRHVAMLDPHALSQNLFVHEAMALGLNTYVDEKTLSPKLDGLDVLAPRLARFVGLLPSRDDDASPSVSWPSLTTLGVGPHQVHIASRWEDVDRLWADGSDKGAAIGLALVGRQMDISALAQSVTERDLDVLLCEALFYGQHTGLLSSQALQGQLRGQIKQMFSFGLFDAADSLEAGIRHHLAQVQPKVLILFDPMLWPSKRAWWLEQLEKMAARWSRHAEGPERRLAIVGHADAARWDGHDRRIGAGVASMDLQHGLTEAAPGYFSVVRMRFNEHPDIHEPLFVGSQGGLNVSTRELWHARRWRMEHFAQALKHDLVDGVFSVLGPSLTQAHAARIAFGQQPVPLMGVLHSIHPPQGLLEQMMLHLSGEMMPYDAFISPSVCGKQAFEHMVENTLGWLRTQGVARKMPKAPIEVIPYGVDTALFGGRSKAACRMSLGLPLQGILLLSLMRFSRENKADLAPLVLAFAELLQTQPDTYLILSGATNQPKELTRLLLLAEKLGVSERVIIRSDLSLDDKIQLLHAADIFVALSDNVQETFGLNVVEAMAAGLPVVASCWNGYRELVVEGETGTLVPTLWGRFPRERELPAALAAGYFAYTCHADLYQTVAVEVPGVVSALKPLVKSAELRQRWGKAGRRRAKSNYDLLGQGKVMLDLMHERVAMARQSQAPKPHGQVLHDPLTERFGHYPSDILEDDAWLVPSPWTHDKTAVVAAVEALQLGDVVAEEALWLLIRRMPRHGAPVEKLMTPQLDKMRLLRALKYDLVRRGLPPA